MGCCQAHPELHRTPSGKEGIEDELVIEGIKSKFDGDGGEQDAMMKLIARLDEIWEQYDQDNDDVLNKQEGTEFLKSCLQ